VIPEVCGDRAPSQASAERPIRVLLVTDKLGLPGFRLHGLGRAILEWNRVFDPARVVLLTCVLRDSSGLADELRQKGFQITFLNHGRFSPATLLDLLRIIRDQRIDVLHLNGYGAATLGRLAAMLRRKPAIVHVHSDGHHDPAGYPIYVQMFDRVLARATARAVVISQTVKDFAIDAMGFEAAQVEIVHHFAPRLEYDVAPELVEALRQRYALPADAPVVGVFSRMQAVKGHHILLAALPGVLRACPKTRLLLVGEGPERPALEAQARTLGIEANVHFLGFQEDIPTHLKLCWVTVVPSVHPEPFALVAVESLASGVPVVASRTGALPDVIVDGVAGALFQPGDPDDLAKVLTAILQSPERRQQLASNCAVEIKRFSARTFVERMERVYREVCARDPPPAPSRA
jgi:glycosyltransferase involved in cell wall biosynthesis